MLGKLGTSALLGLLLGLAAVAFLQPTRTSGATLVILVCMAAAIAVGGLLARRAAAKPGREKSP